MTTALTIGIWCVVAWIALMCIATLVAIYRMWDER